MKITFFRIKGYVNILNGMGLDELIIPFNTFKNRIVLISGQNGTGKSTIIQALSPNPDSSDSFRTDVFIDNYGNRQIIEYPAEKEIWYSSVDETGPHEYKILIQSLVDDSKTRRTTKAFISKDGEEMNPNGNVSSFKEIRDSLLGIDPTYLDLSSISSEHRGIVDMIPSERRKYMASYIGSLDTYNNIFKTISKKANSLKSYMNTLNAKIYEAGNEAELRVKLIHLEEELKQNKEYRDKLLKDISEAETTIHILDPDNKMQDLYSSISDRLGALKYEIEQNNKKHVYLYSLLNLSGEIENIEDEIGNTKRNIETNKNTFANNESSITSLMSINEEANRSLDDDKSRLNSIDSSTIQDNIEETVNSLISERDEYNKYLSKEDIKLLSSTSIDELKDLKIALDEFVNEIQIIEDTYDNSIFISAMEYFSVAVNDIIKQKQFLQNDINNINTKISTLSMEIEYKTENLSKLDKFNNTRPKECVIDNCPYISEFINIKNSNISEEEIQMMKDTLSSYKDSVKEKSIKLENFDKIVDIILKLQPLYSSILTRSILKKIVELKFLFDSNKVINRITNFNRFDEIKILDSLIEKYSIFNEITNINSQLSDLESDLKIYKSNKNLTESLNNSIITKTKEIENRNNEIIRLSKENKVLEESINSMNTRLDNLNQYSENIKNIEDCNNRKDSLKKEFDSVKDNIQTVKNKVDSLNLLKDELSRYDNIINPLSENINEIKYTLSNIVSYQQEFKNVSEKYEKITFIRNACSPGNGKGIQSEYIKRYMNDIIIDCNSMLAYMFDGSIQLDIPIINEKQFSIPFVGLGGLIVPDISNGSTAQRCMIGLVFSCVAMMKSSTKYNIPRFDEIDGGLDSSNRVTFISVLNNILDFMRSEQCIICSHNTEFEAYNTTRIYTSIGGITIEQ